MKLKSKNIEVEGAVEDLIQTICSYNLDKHVEAISAEEIQKLSKDYNWSMYQALLHATKYSLNAMKERICGRRNQPKMQLKPFFDVDVLLENGQWILKPSLEDIQSAINRAASHVLKSTKNVQNWNQKDIPEDKREPFYDWIAKDKEIVKVILLLTGSIQGTKNAVHTFVESFEEYQVSLLISLVNSGFETKISMTVLRHLQEVHLNSKTMKRNSKNSQILSTRYDSIHNV